MPIVVSHEINKAGAGKAISKIGERQRRQSAAKSIADIVKAFVAGGPGGGGLEIANQLGGGGGAPGPASLSGATGRRQPTRRQAQQPLGAQFGDTMQSRLRRSRGTAGGSQEFLANALPNLIPQMTQNQWESLSPAQQQKVDRAKQAISMVNNSPSMTPQMKEDSIRKLQKEIVNEVSTPGKPPSQFPKGKGLKDIWTDEQTGNIVTRNKDGTMKVAVKYEDTKSFIDAEQKRKDVAGFQDRYMDVYKMVADSISGIVDEETNQQMMPSDGVVRGILAAMDEEFRGGLPTTQDPVEARKFIDAARGGKQGAAIGAGRAPAQGPQAAPADPVKAEADAQLQAALAGVPKPGITPEAVQPDRLGDVQPDRLGAAGKSFEEAENLIDKVLGFGEGASKREREKRKGDAAVADRKQKASAAVKSIQSAMQSGDVKSLRLGIRILSKQVGEKNLSEILEKLGLR